jgi:sec-independent protein translocase protein TatA
MMDKLILAVGGFGMPEILVILAIVVLLFGASRLPQLAKALGQSKRAFRDAASACAQSTPALSKTKAAPAISPKFKVQGPKSESIALDFGPWVLTVDCLLFPFCFAPDEERGLD